MRRVTIRDVWACHACSKGARAFFKQNRLDWNDFLENGIDAEILIATGDAMALQVVEAAHGRKE